MSSELQKNMAAIEAAALSAGRVVGAWVESMRPAVAKFAKGLHDAAWSAYREAGTPYGETEDGCLRWVRERQRAANLRAEADRIESVHATCARLRAARP